MSVPFIIFFKIVINGDCSVIIMQDQYRSIILDKKESERYAIFLTHGRNQYIFPENESKHYYKQIHIQRIDPSLCNYSFISHLYIFDDENSSNNQYGG